jgi:adenylate cyclase
LTIIATRWGIRDGRVVPEPNGIKFLGDAVKLDGTFLYADLADSTRIAALDRHLAAEIFQAFLSTAARVLRNFGGEIRSFDGDRVMAVFMGDDRNLRAARAAFGLNWAFSKVLKPKIEAAYSTKLAGLVLNYGCGMDAGSVWAIRGGVRDNSDLVWVGGAPNLAAKLSELRNGHYGTWITGSLYDALPQERKFHSPDGSAMWEERKWTAYRGLRIYRSSWWREP